MVAFSSISARPRYRNRASAGSVPFVNATLQLASLGTTSISANVSLQRSLAGRIPTIAFSNLAAPPSTQRASVPDRLNIGNATPQSFGDPANLEAFGKDIGERISNPFDNKPLGGSSQGQRDFFNVFPGGAASQIGANTVSPIGFTGSGSFSNPPITLAGPGGAS